MMSCSIAETPGQGEPWVREGLDVSVGTKTMQSYLETGVLHMCRLPEGPAQPQLV